MESVIPTDVLNHLRGLAKREGSLEGLFTTRQLAEELGCGEDKARRIIRPLLQEGRVRPRRVNISDEQAHELGLLGGTSLRCYEWIEAA